VIIEKMKNSPPNPKKRNGESTIILEEKAITILESVDSLKDVEYTPFTTEYDAYTKPPLRTRPRRCMMAKMKNDPMRMTTE
jgi:hypothetical protein